MCFKFGYTYFFLENHVVGFKKPNVFLILSKNMIMLITRAMSKTKKIIKPTISF